jgi:hypothetical protein
MGCHGWGPDKDGDAADIMSSSVFHLYDRTPVLVQVNSECSFCSLLSLVPDKQTRLSWRKLIKLDRSRQSI